MDALPHVVLTWLATAPGGAERSVPELAHELATAGLHVTLVWWRPPEGPPAPLAGTVDVREVRSAHAYRVALEGALSDGVAVVIGNHRTALIDLEHTDAAGVPLLVVLRAMFQPGQHLRIVDPVTGCLVEHTPATLPWSRLRGVGSWVGISKAATQSIVANAPGPIRATTIYNGVPVGSGVPTGPAHFDGALRLAAVGRAVPWKRLDVLVDAVADPRLRERVSLDVFGADGSARWALDEQVTRLGAPVRFRGWVPDLPQQLTDAHLMVSASPAEGFGRGILDGAAVGLAAVVPDSGAGPELVLDGLTGYTYSVADPEALPALLDRIAGDDFANLRAMGQCARARVAGYFTPARCANEYLALCHQLLREPAVAP